MKIETISDSEEKKRISRLTLEALSQWFGFETAREEYIQDSAARSFFACFNNGVPVGFL